MNKDTMLIEEIAALASGIEDNKLAIASLLKMAIGVGCKSNKENCRNCPLTSYICREIHERAKILEGRVDCE